MSIRASFQKLGQRPLCNFFVARCVFFCVIELSLSLNEDGYLHRRTKTFFRVTMGGRFQEISYLRQA